MKKPSIESFVFDQIEVNVLRALEASTTYQSSKQKILSLYDPVKNPSTKPDSVVLKKIDQIYDMIVLLVACIWIDPIVAVLIKETLWTKFISKSWDLYDLRFLFEEPEIVLTWLLSTQRIDDRNVRGIFSETNVLKVLSRVNWKIIWPKTSRPRRKIRHKGYRDKGSLPDHGRLVRTLAVHEDIYYNLEREAKGTMDLALKYWYLENLKALQKKRSESNTIFKGETENDKNRFIKSIGHEIGKAGSLTRFIFDEEGEILSAYRRNSGQNNTSESTDQERGRELTEEAVRVLLERRRKERRIRGNGTSAQTLS